MIVRKVGQPYSFASVQVASEVPVRRMNCGLRFRRGSGEIWPDQRSQGRREGQTMVGMRITIEAGAVLLLIDVQRAFDDPYWGTRNNPAAEANIAALAGAWTAAGRPVVRVRHASVQPSSPLRPDAPGHAYKPEVADLTPDLELVKSVHSAFLGTPDLHEWLTARDARQLVITGIQTNRCCETTARVAGDLGYDTLFAIDATYTFDEVGPDGTAVTGDQFAAVTAANLHGNFARVVRTAELAG